MAYYITEDIVKQIEEEGDSIALVFFSGKSCDSPMTCSGKSCDCHVTYIVSHVTLSLSFVIMCFNYTNP